MKRRTTFPEPEAGSKHTSITEAPTVVEKQLLQKFDALSDDKVEKAMGLVIRCTVDVGRYRRSLAKRPEHTPHYERMVKAAENFANLRLNMLHAEDPATARTVCSQIESFDWPAISPIVTTEIPYGGSEASINLSFRNPTPPTRNNLPA